MFGEPTSRDRLWRLLLDPTRCFWNCAYSFEELKVVLLLPACTPLLLCPSIFEFASPQEIERLETSSLCDSAKKHLSIYMQNDPEKNWFDLSSNPDHRKRTETVDGALFTLTTNTRIWFLGIVASVC